MSQTIYGHLNSQLSGFADLAMFRNAYVSADSVLREAESLGSVEQKAPVNGEGPADIPIDLGKTCDAGMTRFLDAPGGIFTHKTLFTQAENLVHDHKVSAQNRLPEQMNEDRYVDRNTMATVLFRPCVSADKAIENQARVLAKILESKLIAEKKADRANAPQDGKALPPSSEEEPTLTNEERASVLDNCRTAIGKMLQTDAVREMFVNQPTAIQYAEQLRFAAQILQLRLNDLLTLVKNGDGSSVEARKQTIGGTLTTLLGQFQRYGACIAELEEIGRNQDSTASVRTLSDRAVGEFAVIGRQIAMLQRYLSNGTPPADLPTVKVDADISSFSLGILNNALGLAELLQKGMISADAAVTLANEARVSSLENSRDVLNLQYNALQSAKEAFTQEKKFALYLDDLRTQADRDPEKLARYRETARQVFEIVEKRKMYARVLDVSLRDRFCADGTPDEDFRHALIDDYRERLMQFRFDLEWHAGEVGREFGHMKVSYYGGMERIRRGLSNRFARNKHADQRFASTSESEKFFQAMKAFELDKGELIGDFNAFCTRRGLVSEEAKRIAETTDDDLLRRIRTASTITHETNNAVRDYVDEGRFRKEYRAYAEKVLGLLDDGGTRSIVTNVKITLAGELGLESVAKSRLSVGGYVRTAVTLSRNKGGCYVLDLSDEKGGEVSAGGSAAKKAVDGEVSLKGGKGHGRQLIFNDRDELVIFLRQNAPDLLREIPGAVTLKDKEPIDAALVISPVTLERTNKALNVLKGISSMLGFRIHRTKYFSEAAFEQKMRDADVFSRLAKIEEDRKNALAKSLRTRDTLAGSLGAKFKFGKTETKSGTVTSTTEAKFEVGGSLSLGGERNVKMRNLRTAHDAFKYHSAADMRAYVVLPETKDLPAALAANRVSEAFGSELADFKAFVTDLLATADPAGTTPEQRFKNLRSAYDRLQGKYDRAEAAFLRLPVPEQKKAANQKTFAQTVHAFAVLNEYLAKEAGELAKALTASGVPGLDETARTRLLDECTRLADAANGDFAKRLERPRVELQGTLMQEYVMFSTEQKASGVFILGVDADGKYRRDPQTTKTDSADKAPGPLENFAKALADAGPQVLVKKALDSLKDFANQPNAKISVKWRRPLNTTTADRPWLNQGSLTFDVKIGMPASPLAVIVPLAEAIYEMNTKADGVEDENERMSVKRACTDALRNLAEQLVNLLAIETDAAVAKAATGFLGLFLPDMPFGLTGSVTNDTYATCSFKFEEGLFSSFKFGEDFTHTEALKFKLKIPLTGASIEVNRSTARSQGTTYFELMSDPPVTTFLSRTLDVRGSVQGGPEGAKAFLRSHQKAVNQMIALFRDRDGLMSVGPNPKGDGLGAGVRLPFAKSRNLRLLANVRRDMEKLRLIADCDQDGFPQEMRTEARNFYRELFRTQRDFAPLEGDQLGLWEQVARPAQPGETDEDRVALLSNVFGKLGAAYDLISRAADHVTKYMDGKGLNLLSSNPDLLKGTNRLFQLYKGPLNVPSESQNVPEVKPEIAPEIREQSKEIPESDREVRLEPSKGENLALRRENLLPAGQWKIAEGSRDVPKALDVPFPDARNVMFGQTQGGNTCPIISVVNAFLFSGGSLSDRMRATFTWKPDANPDRGRYLEFPASDSEKPLRIYENDPELDFETLVKANPTWKDILKANGPEYREERKKCWNAFSSYERAAFLALNKIARKDGKHQPQQDVLPGEPFEVGCVYALFGCAEPTGFAVMRNGATEAWKKLFAKVDEALLANQPCVLHCAGHFRAVVGVHYDEANGGITLDVIESMRNDSNANGLPPAVLSLTQAELVSAMDEKGATVFGVANEVF